MNTSHTLEENNLESRLRLERKALQERVQTQLHCSDDPQQVSLARHLAEAGDWVIADLQGDIDISMIEHELSTLRDIDAALKRIANGTYGTCMSCSKEIDPKRLNAQPAARMCVVCKEAFEKRRGIVTQRTI
jgi:DnaK suppressor protein